MLVVLLYASAAFGLSPEEVRLARQSFEQARAISDRDAGRLWGIELYGPMMLVHPDSRRIFANQADGAGKLTELDGVFVGQLPASENVSNTAMDWAGVRWTMLRLPLPQDSDARARLLAHEMWHRIQDRLKLPMASPANAHLDSHDGRVWMILEWRALARALQTGGAESQKAVKDAALFRRYRRSLFPRAAAEENALELNEGLAEYTGVALTSPSASEARAHAAQALQSAESSETMARSFAYASGPPWALLLDLHCDDWRSRLSDSSDLAAMLQDAMGIEWEESGGKPFNMSRAEEYGAPVLIAAEKQRAQKKEAVLAELRTRFVAGPVLRLPLRNMKVGFDPNRVQPLDNLGSVYFAARITDDWGVLTADEGVLIANDWTWAQIPAPAESAELRTQGPGWQLELSDGWTVDPGPDPDRWRHGRVLRSR